MDWFRAQYAGGQALGGNPYYAPLNATDLSGFPSAIHAFAQMPMLDMAADAITKLCAFAKRNG